MDSLPPEWRSRLATASAVGGALLVLNYLDKSTLFSKDLGFIFKLAQVQKAANQHLSQNDTTADIWEQKIKQWPKNIAFLFEGKKYTFEEVEQGANRVANWALQKGIKKGDVVALNMDNRPEYFMTWLGIAKVGGITALINYNVKGKSLVHSIKISGAKFLIVGHKVQDTVAEVLQELKDLGISFFGRGGSISYAEDLDAAISTQSVTAPPRKVREGVKFTDKVLLVYTSGTTGLPKAATIKHLRFFNMGKIFVTVYGIQKTDIIYCVLPLYHSAGGLVGIGMMLQSGATLALKAKFSLREFWDDCRSTKATVIQYIGELCRYLVGAPKQQNDGVNNVRIAIGNGLRPEIWDEFQDRFKIPEVGEFYGSTEGNAALLNHCKDKRSRGSVGQMGSLLYKLAKLKVVKFDITTEEPVKGKDGFLIEVGPGESGELLGEIVEDDPVRGFDGYHDNKEATNKKIYKDAFKKGDLYFRTGDLMKRDKDGYWYFVDRIGDTFRWKGENVSTTEVAEVVSTFPGVTEVNVYGIEVPGQPDGRACMAAMVFNDDLKFEGLAKHCKDRLPTYAVPLFIRREGAIEITSTFKHQKVHLRQQGCDPAKVKDPLWWLDPKKGTYVPFGAQEFEDLQKGRSKL